MYICMHKGLPNGEPGETNHTYYFVVDSVRASLGYVSKWFVFPTILQYVPGSDILRSTCGSLVSSTGELTFCFQWYV